MSSILTNEFIENILKEFADKASYKFETNYDRYSGCNQVRTIIYSKFINGTILRFSFELLGGALIRIVPSRTRIGYNGHYMDTLQPIIEVNLHSPNSLNIIEKLMCELE